MTVTEADAKAASVEWATPRALFDRLDAVFAFTLDPCATPGNAKCARFHTAADDGLSKPWAGERVFLNPPYGKACPAWVEKARREARHPGTVVVALVVPRTDTDWFHRSCGTASRVVLLKGRVRFENPGNPGRSPQDPSCVVVFTPADAGPPELAFWDWKRDPFPR